MGERAPKKTTDLNRNSATCFRILWTSPSLEDLICPPKKIGPGEFVPASLNVTHLHHGYMHHGYVHHGYMHHQQSESRIHALWTPSWTHLRGSHGLSARRARRTKSSRPEGPKAGPKGRKLEVGPQRGPRLLYIYIYSSCCWQQISQRVLLLIGLYIAAGRLRWKIKFVSNFQIL